MSWNNLSGRLWLSFLIPLLWWQGCSCPPDQQVGSLDLAPETMAWLPYNGGETLFFENADGEKLVLQNSSGKQVERDHLCTKTLCTEARYDGESSCEYVASQSVRLIFSDNHGLALFDLLLYSKAYSPAEHHFVDLIRLTMSMGTPVTTAEWVTQVRFGTAYDPDKVGLQGTLRFLDRIVLNGTPFAEVYGFRTETLSLYYTKRRGLVGFETLTGTWHLVQRIG